MIVIKICSLFWTLMGDANCLVSYREVLGRVRTFADKFKKNKRLKELCHRNCILKNLVSFFKFVIRNPSQLFAVVAVLVYFQCYILILWLLILGNYFCEVSFKIKRNQKKRKIWWHCSFKARCTIVIWWYDISGVLQLFLQYLKQCL